MRGFLGLTLLGLSSVSLAAGWTGDLTVESTFTEDSDLIIAYTSGGVVYTNGCGANSWSFKASNDDRRNRAYSTLMTALVSGKKIRFWYQDECAEWSYHGATAVKLVK